MTEDLIEKTLSAGIEPFGIEYYPIISYGTQETVGYRSVLRINSIELGTLYPEQYRVVTNRNTGCVRLSAFCLKTVCSQLKDIKKENCFFSIYIPEKLLKNEMLFKLLDEITAQDGVPAERLCFELSSDILLAEPKELHNVFEKLKQSGITFMLSEFGDSFCPVMRLKDFPFDYVLLDRSISNAKRIADTDVQAIISMIDSLGISSVYYGKDFSKAAESGCRFFCASKPTKLVKVSEHEKI